MDKADVAVASALAFIEAHGVVLASARGPAPRMIDAIAGESIVGNWWSHPNANAIYNVLSTASESSDVLACRLVGGKVTLVHRRLWPALVRLADRFAAERISQVRNEHTASGRHVVRELQERTGFILAPVVHCDFEALRQDVLAHPATHDAGTDPANPCLARLCIAYRHDSDLVDF